MDDILLPMESELCLQQLYDEVTTTLQNNGLLVAPDKIQLKAPFNYMGHIMAATAAAKSLQSCLTLCNPRDNSPPGSAVPGILQARTLECVAISFSTCIAALISINLYL